MIHWDTSALIKCYVALEQGHARAKSLLLREKGHKGSALLWPEAVSAIVRKLHRDRQLCDSLVGLLEGHLKRFDLLPVDQAQLALTVRLIRRHRLRSGDAIHLAGALFLARELGRGGLRFATSDGPQAAAARAEGLKVVELSS